MPETTQRATVYEAILASGPSGAVYRGALLSFADAVKRRKLGEDVVVCGSSLTANRAMAQEIESRIGRWEAHHPHQHTVGKESLPHLHQESRSPEGHCFYETENRKARTRNPKPRKRS